MQIFLCSLAHDTKRRMSVKEMHAGITCSIYGTGNGAISYIAHIVVYEQSVLADQMS